jgi:uncharacterized protein (DUF362 family)
MESTEKSVVAAVRCGSYDTGMVYAAVCRQFELLGGVERFIQPGLRVLIKPNLIVPRPAEVPAQTHPEVIYAVARIVKEHGAIPLVGDSPAWGNTRGCLKALGIDTRLETLGAEIVQLDQPVRMEIAGVRVGISRVTLEADAIINLPKLKAHQQLGATFAFKNMYGCVAGLGGKEKAWWHFARGKEFEPFCRMIIGIYHTLHPVLNVIDGIVGMEGQGPINGQPKEVGYLIAGTDPAACERVCCDLVGFDPKHLPLLVTAEAMAPGSMAAPIQVVGDIFNSPACSDFKPAIQTPLRFTFPHICKSIGKQAVILLRHRSGKTKGVRHR